MPKKKPAISTEDLMGEVGPEHFPDDEGQVKPTRRRPMRAKVKTVKEVEEDDHQPEGRALEVEEVERFDTFLTRPKPKMGQETADMLFRKMPPSRRDNGSTPTR